MSYCAWWCLLRIAYQGLERSPSRGRSPSGPDAHGGELGLVI
jgi:hypothetical protein